VEPSKVTQLSELIGLDLTENSHQSYLQEHFKSDEEEYFPYKLVYDEDVYHEFRFDRVDFMDTKPSLFGIEFDRVKIRSKNQIPKMFTLVGESPSKDYYNYFRDEVIKVLGSPDSSLIVYDNVEELRWGDITKNGIRVTNDCLLTWVIGLENCVTINLGIDNVDYEQSLPRNEDKVPQILNMDNITEETVGVILKNDDTRYSRFKIYTIDYKTHLFDLIELHPKYIEGVEGIGYNVYTRIRLKGEDDSTFSYELGKVFSEEYNVEIHFRDRVSEVYHYPLKGFNITLHDEEISIQPSYNDNRFTVGELIDRTLL
jgi:hypothetical protein